MYEIFKLEIEVSYLEKFELLKKVYEVFFLEIKKGYEIEKKLFEDLFFEK